MFVRIRRFESLQHLRVPFEGEAGSKGSLHLRDLEHYVDLFAGFVSLERTAGALCRYSPFQIGSSAFSFS